MMYKTIFFKNHFLKFFLIFLILLSYYRSPFIFNHGRFFDLDIHYHLLSGSLSFFDSLIYVDINPRYLNLTSNISSLISSRLFDLEYAQYVPVYLSFLVYLIIFYQILFKKSYLFKKEYQKYLGSLICLVAPVMNFEIWLNVVNLQVYLGVLGLVILFIKEEDNNSINYFLLTMGGLTGIYTCLLTPLFFLKYLAKRNFSNLICFLVLTFCSLIQFIIIFYVIMDVNPIGTYDAALTGVLTKYEPISYYYNVVIRLFIGSSLPTYLMSLFDINLYNTLYNESIKNLLFIFSILALLVSFFLILFFFISIKNRKDKLIYFILLIFFIEVSLTVIFGGVTDSLHGRYSSLPGITLIFSFLFLSNASEVKWVKNFSLYLMISTIVFGLIDFRLEKYIIFLDCINCPNWSEEVAKYKLDKNYQLRIWPYHHDR